ncbi:MAG: nitroreductase family protein [Candidatus Limnocylindrales bacterium]
MREFTEEAVDPAALEAMTEVARWSGSSRNTQPWRFIVIREPATIRRLNEAGLPQTRSLRTATAAIAIVLPADPTGTASLTYDDGRAAERMLIAASMLDLGAGIAWIREDVRAAASQILGLPDDRLVRTVMALGHPTEAARQPKSAPGQARLSRSELIFEERWPGD